MSYSFEVSAPAFLKKRLYPQIILTENGSNILIFAIYTWNGKIFHSKLSGWPPTIDM